MKVVAVSEYTEAKYETTCKAIHSMYEQVRKVSSKLDVSFRRISFNGLDFGESETLDKFYNADMAVLDITIDSQRLGLLYQKGIRENLGHSNDLVLVYSPNPKRVQDLKCFLSGCNVIYYMYDEKSDTVYESGEELKQGLTVKLKRFFFIAHRNSRERLSDRYVEVIRRAKERKLDAVQMKEVLWNDVIFEAFNEKNIQDVTTDLIVNLLFSFRDIQCYDSMVKFEEICLRNSKLNFKVNKSSLIMYLFAFARTRRNKNNDRNRAIEILQRLTLSKENHVPDILGLFGRIYKDKFLESDCTDVKARDTSIYWYKKSFNVQPNIYAGINLITLLAASGQTLSKDESFNTYASVVSNLIGQKGDINTVKNYWDVASYFELQVILKNFDKANAAALRMYMLNPPIWYLKSTMFNIRFLNEKVLKKIGNAQEVDRKTESQQLFDFWLDFFLDAISDDCSAINYPIITASSLDNFNDLTEGYVNISQIEDDDDKNLIFDLFYKDRFVDKRNSISCTQILSLAQSQDQRALFIYLADNLECHRIFFSKAERCKQFYTAVHATQQINLPEDVSEIEFAYDLDEKKRRKEIGHGTYGRVFLAHDLNNPFVKYAVKEFAVRNDAALETLRNEIKILSFLRHRHIVRYYGSVIETLNGTSSLKIILEYVDGGTLTQLLFDYGSFTENVIRTYTKQILKGLEYLHDNRIVHRDIKGANILVNQYNGEVKISDFGTSKRIAGLNQLAEDSVGTVQYMAPDVINVSGQGYGFPADVWSLGCTVIEMAIGKPPYSNVKNQFSLFLEIGTKLSHPTIPEYLSESLKDFLLCCFKPDPESRSTVKELLKHPFFRKKSGTADNSLTVVMSPRHLRQSSQSNENSEHNCDTSTNESNSSNNPPFDYQKQISVINNARRRCLAEYIQCDMTRLLRYLEKHIQSSGGNSPSSKNLNVFVKAIVESLLTQCFDHVLIAVNKLRASEPLEMCSNANLEKLFYCLVPAVNDLLRNRSLTPHQMFSMDNVFRHLIENLVTVIFENHAILNNQDILSLPSFGSVSMYSNDYKDLYEAYLNAVKLNKTLAHQLITTESKYSLLLKNYISMQENRMKIIAMVKKLLTTTNNESFDCTGHFPMELVKWLREIGVNNSAIISLVEQQYTLDFILNELTYEQLEKTSLTEKDKLTIWRNVLESRKQKRDGDSSETSNSISF